MVDIKSCSPILCELNLRALTWFIVAAEMTLLGIIWPLWALYVWTLKPIPYADECLASYGPGTHCCSECLSLLPCCCYLVISHDYSTFLWSHIASSVLPDTVLCVLVGGGQPETILQLPSENPSGWNLSAVRIYTHVQIFRTHAGPFLSLKMFWNSSNRCTLPASLYCTVLV